jgi:hypothetical protein
MLSDMEYLNKLAAIDVWVKAEKKDAELQNIIAEQKIRTQRILGRLLESQEFDKGGGDTSTGNRRQLVQKTKLDDIGLTKKQSSTFQQIASIPDNDFEEFIVLKNGDTFVLIHCSPYSQGQRPLGLFF